MCLVQVDEVGGGDLRQMADFRGASAAEMVTWAAEKWLYGVLWGAAQPHGPPAAAYRVGLAIGVFRRPTLR